MAGEPPNPYAPSASLTDAPAKAAAPRRPSRLLAVAATVFAVPLAGAGLYVLGRTRRFRGWFVAGLAFWIVMLASVRTQHPTLFLIGFAGALTVWLASIVDSIIAARGTWPAAGRALLFALLFVVGARAQNRVVQTWIAEGFQIPSGAMMPTLLVGDSIMVKKDQHAARGDVIVFKFPLDPSTDYVFRVVAVGGDVLAVRDGVPSINGVPLAHADVAGDCPVNEEPGHEDDETAPCRLVRETNGRRAYTIMLAPTRHAPDFGPKTVPAGEVYVLGDNRDNSYDSRRWGGVPFDHIKGTASFTWWSTSPRSGARRPRIGRIVE
jgi:signal peptidase I